MVHLDHNAKSSTGLVIPSNGATHYSFRSAGQMKSHCQSQCGPFLGQLSSKFRNPLTVRPGMGIQIRKPAIRLIDFDGEPHIK